VFVGPVVLFVSLVSALAVANVWATSTWKSAAAGYRFEFPRDHASHPDYKIEWWYYTGNVETAQGRRFGYQLTFFRIGVDPTPANPSRWAVRDLYMTHLAVTDTQARRYRHAERLSRGGPGLAGADASRYRVWNADWSASLDAAGRHVLQAIGPTAGLSLVLEEGKPAAVNGVNGVSQKGSQPGNASHYYSLTRMPTRGTLLVDGERYEVTGLSWMDREFGTSFLEPEQQGWDWLSIQLQDGRDLMLYQLRRSDGSRDPRSSGTLVDSEGRTRHLTAADFTLQPAGTTFRAPSGATYPIRWRVEIPSEGVSLEVTTPLDNQELTTEASGISYWEGAIDARGLSRGAPLSGRGYLEMTGYKGSLGRVLSGR
jgi:predicted secreted hydrolase